MKINLLKAAFLTVSLSTWAFAETGGTTAGKSEPVHSSPSEPQGTGITGTGKSGHYANADAKGTPKVTAPLIADPMALFQQLDTDKDGKLTMEEFRQISKVLSGTTGSAAAAPAQTAK